MEMAAAAATGGDDDSLDVVLDFNIDDLDLMLEAAAAEFHDAYTAFLASANSSGKKKSVGGGWLGESRGDGKGSGRESGSPDGAGDDGDEAMSAYVSELERFLLMDDDGGLVGGDAAACPDAELAAEGLASVHDYFGDLLRDGEVVCSVEPPAGGGGGSGHEENEKHVLAAREDDEPASRKRARNRIKGTSMMPWGELEVTRMHLAQIQPCHQRLLCCM